MQLPDTIEAILALPCVPYVDRDQLPCGPGIYFITSSDDALLYIGRSNDIHFRWTNHHKIGDVDFTGSHSRIHWMLIADIEVIPGVEVRLIHRFRPPLNIQHGIRRSAPLIQANSTDGSILPGITDIRDVPKVKSWIAGDTDILPLILKDYTFRQRSGCCSFCGEPFPLKEIVTAPSFDEVAAGHRDAFGRYLVCKCCRGIVRPRNQFKSIEDQKRDILDVAQKRVSRVFSILARYGFSSPDLESFLDTIPEARLTFHFENESDG